jgi:hypothetical protein
MNKEDINKIIKSNPDSYVQIIKSKHKDFYNQINVEYSGKTFGEKLYNSIYGERKCKVCNNQTKFRSFTVGYSEYCSKKCSNISTVSVRTNALIEKNKQNRHLYYETKKCLVCSINFESLIYRNQKCCGAKCSGIYVAKDINRIDKIKNTKLNRYGSATYVNAEKAKLTCIEKYGVDNISKTEYFKDLAKSESKKRFFDNILNHKLSTVAIPLFTQEDYISTDKNNLYKFKCKQCNDIFEDHIDGGHLPRCLKCNPYIAGFSHNEKEIVNKMVYIWNKVFEYSISPIKAYSNKKNQEVLLNLYKTAFSGDLNNWREYACKINSSQFLMGEKKTKNNFKAVFSWLIKEETIEKIMNGEYGIGDRELDMNNVTKNIGYGALYGITYPLSIPIHLMHVFYWSKHKYNYALCVMSNYPRIK